MQSRALKKPVSSIFADLDSYAVPDHPPASASIAFLPPPSPRVLLADDCGPSRQLTRLLLERLGCLVDEAEDGLEAVEAARSGRHDLIFMDISMPLLDGIEAARRIRRAGCRTPIVALSAYIGSGFSARCEAAGLNGQLAKPVTSAMLRTCVAAHAPKRSTEGSLVAPRPVVIDPVAFDMLPLRALLGDLEDGDDPADSLFTRVTTSFRRDLDALTGELVATLANKEDPASGTSAVAVAHKLGALANTVGAKALGRLALMVEQGKAGAGERLTLKRVAAVAMQAYSEALERIDLERRQALTLA
jgi:CheY-like chemotaxis protein